MKARIISPFQPSLGYGSFFTLAFSVEKAPAKEASTEQGLCPELQVLYSRAFIFAELYLYSLEMSGQLDVSCDGSGASLLPSAL